MRAQQISSAVELISIPLAPYISGPNSSEQQPHDHWTPSGPGGGTSGRALLGVILQRPPFKLSVVYVSCSLSHLSICPIHCSASSAASKVLCRSLLGEDHAGPVAKGRCPVRSRTGRRTGCFPGWAPSPQGSAAQGSRSSRRSIAGHRAINGFIVNSSGWLRNSFENSGSYL